MSLHWSQEIYVVIRAQALDTPALKKFHSDRKRDQKGLTNSPAALISIRHEVIAKPYVIPECLYPRYKRSGADMVFQAVRTRFPLRIVARPLRNLKIGSRKRALEIFRGTLPP
jgi:hypothetical protein